MPVSIIQTQIVWDQTYKLEVTDLKFSKLDGSISKPVRRYDFHRSDMVGILVFDISTNEFIFVEQFRFPMHKAGHETFIEIASGGIEPGEIPEEAAGRECEEETGYRAGSLVPITQVFATPPYSSEKFHLFYTEVDSANFLNTSSGTESEDIRQVRIKITDIDNWIKSGQIQDMKTLLSVFWYFNTFQKS